MLGMTWIWKGHMVEGYEVRGCGLGAGHDGGLNLTQVWRRWTWWAVWSWQAVESFELYWRHGVCSGRGGEGVVAEVPSIISAPVCGGPTVVQVEADAAEAELEAEVDAQEVAAAAAQGAGHGAAAAAGWGAIADGADSDSDDGDSVRQVCLGGLDGAFGEEGGQTLFV